MLILAVGWSMALAIGLFAEAHDPEVLGYEFADGHVHAVRIGDSKRYRSDLERIGGRAAVYADEFNRWFEGLWQGRRLGWTIAVLSGLAALGCGWMGRHSPSPDGDKARRRVADPSANSRPK